MVRWRERQQRVAQPDAIVRRSRSSFPVPGTALLLIDVINDLAFDGSEALVAQAEPMALRLAASEAPHQRRGDSRDLHQRQFRPMAFRLSNDGRPLFVTLVAGTSRVPASEAHLARLLRIEAQALGLL